MLCILPLNFIQVIQFLVHMVYKGKLPEGQGVCVCVCVCVCMHAHTLTHSHVFGCVVHVVFVYMWNVCMCLCVYMLIELIFLEGDGGIELSIRWELHAWGAYNR